MCPYIGRPRSLDYDARPPSSRKFSQRQPRLIDRHRLASFGCLGGGYLGSTLVQGLIVLNNPTDTYISLMARDFTVLGNLPSSSTLSSDAFCQTGRMDFYPSRTWLLGHSESTCILGSTCSCVRWLHSLFERRWLAHSRSLLLRWIYW